MRRPHHLYLPNHLNPAQRAKEHLPSAKIQVVGLRRRRIRYVPSGRMRVVGRKPTLVIATQNPKKEKELRDMLGKVPFRVRSLSAFPGAPKVRETARTFRGNAILKARSAARHTRCWVLADDSGLEVDYLGGCPGVRTARYARARRGMSQDEANNRKLLRALKGVPGSRRRARFRCVIALLSPKGKLYLTEGAVTGRIGEEAKGTYGFGYDPLFVIPRYGRSLAQLGARVKRRMSHRALAVRKAVRWLQSQG